MEVWKCGVRRTCIEHFNFRKVKWMLSQWIHSAHVNDDLLFGKSLKILNKNFFKTRSIPIVLNCECLIIFVMQYIEYSGFRVLLKLPNWNRFNNKAIKINCFSFLIPLCDNKFVNGFGRYDIVFLNRENNETLKGNFRFAGAKRKPIRRQVGR